MHPRTRRNYFSLKSLQVCEIVLVLLISAVSTFATTIENVVVRENISKSNREELAQRLRSITGWKELTFDVDGALRIGNTEAGPGSKSARDLISRTISGSRVILFEDASSRKDVVFCRVVQGRLERKPDADVYIVLIDFSDFRRVSGDKQAQAAFNVGWAVLHEMDHVVENSEDPQQDVAGDCEGHINRMRRELGLPVRNSYFFSFLPIKNDSNLISRFVRLGFDQDSNTSPKRKRYWLIWDAAVVGGLASEAESVRASLDIF
jgi:hypothetical protein